MGKVDPKHFSRIQSELKKAGTTWYGRQKAESRYLPQVIHDNEHLEAVVYGQYPGGSAMLVATDLRILFLDRKPGFTHMDEITYDMVSGLAKTLSGPFTAITLHTRLGDYSFRYVNAKAATRFVEYIEKRRLEHFKVVLDGFQQPSQVPQNKVDTTGFTAQALTFLKEHDLATLSTADKENKVYGAAIYYMVDDDGVIYFVTKSETRKYLNITAHNQVALTIYDAGKMQTLQLQGLAKVENDQTRKDIAFNQIIRSRLSAPGGKIPAVIKIEQGSFIIISITPTVVQFRDFGSR